MQEEALQSFQTKYFSSFEVDDKKFSPPLNYHAFCAQGPRVRDVPPSARQGVEVKSDPDEDQELEEGEGLLVKEEEEERTAGGEEGEEGVVTNLKTEAKSEARDLIEERRKTEEGGRDEGEGGEKEDSEEKRCATISEGVKSEPKGLQLDANNDSKPLHSDSVQLVKAEVNAALLLL